HVRMVIEGKTIENLGIDIPEGKGGAIHAPFDVFAITDGAADLTINGVHAVAESIDLDVTADDDPDEGSSFEIAVRAGTSRVERGRSTGENGPIDAFDEDAICSVEGRLRVEPSDIEVHRLKASVVADLDPKPATLGSCDLPETDRRRVDLSLTHLHVGLPREKGALPRIDGHITARAPIALGARFTKFPDNDGWVGADVDVQFTEGMNLPDVTGHVEAHDIRIERYSFAHEVQSDIATVHVVITSSKTTLAIAGGIATLTDVKVEPLVKGIPLHAKVDVKDADFTKLMADLGVSQHAHVSWGLREVHAASFSGTIVPLKLDADFTAKTDNFGVYDVAYENPARTRIIGVREGNIVAHAGVRPGALTFSNIHATMPKSHVDGGFVSIGFHDDLRVEIPDATVDLAEIGPLGSIPIAGTAHANALVSGLFNDPHVEGDASIDSFSLGGIPFGDVTGGHVSLSGLVVSLKDVKAKKNKSEYEMPSGV
ncbi:MAG: hypothetical protein ACRELY_15105, partial [Polyangiaceae bacterium]